MTSKQEQAAQTRRNLIDAAAQEFRVSGYAGAGVDAIARRAGVTSGAFYRHFVSKSAVFSVVISEGLQQIVEGIRAAKEASPKNWRKAFTDFYFSKVRLKSIENGCALPSLTAEIVRADDDAKEAFRKGLAAIVEEFSDGVHRFGDDEFSRRTLAALSLMSGSLMLARAVKSEKLAVQIAVASAKEVLKLLSKSQ